MSHLGLVAGLGRGGVRRVLDCTDGLGRRAGDLVDAAALRRVRRARANQIHHLAKVGVVG